MSGNLILRPPESLTGGREKPGRLQQLADKIEPLLGPLAEALSEYAPGVGRIAKALKKRARRKRFKAVLFDYIDYAIYSDVSGFQLNSVQFVGDIARMSGDPISIDEAVQVIECARIALNSEKAKQLFEAAGEATRFLRARSRLLCLPNDDKAELRLWEGLVGAFEISRNLVERAPRDTRNWMKQLEIVEGIVRDFLDDRSNGVNANFMACLRTQEWPWSECEKHTVAADLFGKELYDGAEHILVVQHSRDRSLVGFWIPVSNSIDKLMPGAPEALRDGRPRSVPTREPGKFGEAIPPKRAERVCHYLQSTAPFKMFLSLPVHEDGGVKGIVNINLTNEEPKFLVDAEVQRVFLRVEPVLRSIARL